MAGFHTLPQPREARPWCTVRSRARRAAKAPGAMKPTVELTESESPNPIVAHEDSIVVHEASQRM